MELSERIRAGIVAFPNKCTGSLFEGDDAACALGCIAWTLGIGPGDSRASIEHLMELLPELQEKVPFHHPRLANEVLIANAIWMMNDHCHLTREEIAEWLETRPTKS